MTFNDSAIVLRRIDFREADKRLIFYSEHHGLLTAVAIGAKKITSKLSGHLEPFTLVRVMIAAGRQFDKVAQAQTLWRPKNISGERFIYMSATAELIVRATKEGVTDGALFDDLRKVLAWLDTADAAIGRQLWDEFAKKVLKHLGFGEIHSDARAAVQKYLEFDLKSLN